MGQPCHAGTSDPASCPRTSDQPEHGLRDVGVYERHSALQLQHLHQHAVTLCWHPLIQDQAQCRALALEEGLGTKRDTAGEAGALRQHAVHSHHLSQAKVRHTMVPSQALRTCEGPGGPRTQSWLAGMGGS